MKIQNFRINSSVLNLVQNHIKKSYRNSPNIQETWLFRYLYIFNKIYKGQIIMEEDGIPIHINNISKKFNINNSEISKIIKFYLETGIIYRSSGFIVGVTAFKYKINNEFTNNIIKYKMKNTININETELQMENNFFKTYFNNLKQININISLVKLDKIYKTGNQSYEIMCDDIKNKDWYYVQPVKQSRIYHNLCNLKREFKQYLSWGDKQIYQADIRCSQVYLSLIQYLKFSNMPLELQPKDIQDLYNECINGTFYDSLMKITGHTDRNDFKQIFFKYVYYNKPESMNNKISKAFEKLFPTMFYYIKDFKRKNGYKLFSINLQKYEWTLISLVLEELYKLKIPVINLHDAILFPEGENIQLIESLINEIYIKETKYKPSIKIDKF